MAVFVGTSGYAYPQWRGLFYPADRLPVEWLVYYASQFTTVEVNMTFYWLPASPVFRHWEQRTPAGFQFFLKGNRFATHRKRLRNCHDILEMQFERAAALKNKLAGFLWQLPPRFPCQPELFAEFLDELRHMQTVFGQSRQVFEFRDPSWYTNEVYELVAQAGIAIAESDWPYDVRVDKLEDQLTQTELRTAAQAGRPIVEIPQTADFRYFRRYGPVARTAMPYTVADARVLAELIQSAAVATNIFVYFKNDVQDYAITNARELLATLAA